MGRTYRRTQAGNKAVETQDPNLPVEYRRLLDAIGDGAHEVAVKASLSAHPESDVIEWISLMRELGLIESAPGGDDDLDFTGTFKLSAVNRA